MGNDIEPKDLEGLDSSEQVELMKEWFYENYEDPANRTPYESAEGGYIWIWGGPRFTPNIERMASVFLASPR